MEELKKLQSEKSKLEEKSNEAMKLLGLAIKDIPKACCICKHRNRCKFDDCTNKWRWQHQDSYDKLLQEDGHNE